jgi:hypothetical protein
MAAAFTAARFLFSPLELPPLWFPVLRPALFCDPLLLSMLNYRTANCPCIAAPPHVGGVPRGPLLHQHPAKALDIWLAIYWACYTIANYVYHNMLPIACGHSYLNGTGTFNSRCSPGKILAAVPCQHSTGKVLTTVPVPRRYSTEHEFFLKYHDRFIILRC